MTAAAERPAGKPPVPVAGLFVLPLVTAAAIGGAVEGWGGGAAARVAWLVVTIAWAAAASLLLARSEQWLGWLALCLSSLAGAGALATGIATGRSGRDTAWPLVIVAAAGLTGGVAAGKARDRLAHGPERRRVLWVAWALALAVELIVIALALHALVGWPPHLVEIGAIATALLPIGLALGTSKRFESSIARLLVGTISLTGLTGLVVVVYLIVVLGLGQVPTHRQRTLLLLSMAAAGVAALLYVPARKRLADFATRLVHGARQAPDEIVRSFGAGLSRAVPLEELLLQLAESLRSSLTLEAAEIWTGSGERLERIVSDPYRPPASLRLASSEEAVAARGGVAGPAWAAVWMPQLLVDRGATVVRVAPITSAGELFGLIVVERSSDGEPFTEDEENVLQELARRVGLTLRNARLDSELQASLGEILSQADELRASRARVVAAGDAERRRIERDLHDGAQQYLVALAVHLRLARELAESDPAKVAPMLDELLGAVKEAQEGLRDLAHGIYPPLLQDRGLGPALGTAASHASIPARVDARGAGRYRPEIEATVYFCCLEALQNAAKHAGPASQVALRVWEEEGGLLFEVVDDGEGFDVAGGGAGFTNMRDRLGAIGGSLRVESEPGRGTKIAGTIPVER